MLQLPLPLFAAFLAGLASLAVSRAEPSAGWALVFVDEFDGLTLDRTKWTTEMAFAGTHGPRYHNESYLSYTMDDEVVIADGLLHLRTDRRRVTGPEKPGTTFEYTQGLVSTDGKFAFTHGYIEIRARFPGGLGLWPCLWLMPQHQGWPPEFDLAEYYGSQRKMHFGLAHGTMHDPLWDSSGDTTTRFVDEWHVFGFEWMPGRAVWSVDGVARKTIAADYVPNTPMYLILSNSIGSRFGPAGVPDAETVFPNALSIDYVRIYQPAKQLTQNVPVKPVAMPIVDQSAITSEPIP